MLCINTKTCVGYRGLKGRVNGRQVRDQNGAQKGRRMWVAGRTNEGPGRRTKRSDERNKV